MRFVDEFRDADKAHALAAKIAALCEPGRQYKLMEVCGGHTHTIYKHGLEDYLPEQITLVHGPGCPVCVIPMGRVDDAMHLAAEPDVIMTSFGDMMRVPGSNGSFFDAKAARHRHPDGVLAARLAEDRPAEPGQARGVHGHRLRDHRPVHGDDRAAGRRRGAGELLGLLQPRHDHPGHQGDPRLTRPAAGRLHRPWPRVHGDRLPAVRVHRRATTASRSSWPGSSRWTSCSRSTC